MSTKVLNVDDSQSFLETESCMQHSRIFESDEFDTVEQMKHAAIDLTQRWINRKLYPTDILYHADSYQPKIALPYAPINAITEVRATVGGVEEIIDPSMYKLNEVTDVITLDKRLRYYQDFYITYNCGYTSETIPPAVVHAIKMTIADFYENRENVVVGATVAEIPMTAKKIVRQFKNRGFS